MALPSSKGTIIEKTLAKGYPFVRVYPDINSDFYFLYVDSAQGERWATQEQRDKGNVEGCFSPTLATFPKASNNTLVLGVIIAPSCSPRTIVHEIWHAVVNYIVRLSLQISNNVTVDEFWKADYTEELGACCFESLFAQIYYLESIENLRKEYKGKRKRK